MKTCFRQLVSGDTDHGWNYIEPMAQLLSRTYLIPINDARALAWGGLSESQAWQKMMADDVANNTSKTGDIAEINKKYKNLNKSYGTNALGTGCR